MLFFSSWIRLTKYCLVLLGAFLLVIVCIPSCIITYLLFLEKKDYSLRFYDSSIANFFDRIIAHCLCSITYSLHRASNIVDFINNYNKIKFNFTNWSLTVYNNPLKIVYLRTKDDIIGLMKEVEKSNYKIKVRVTNFSHSYSQVFCGQQNEQDYIIGRMLPEKYTYLEARELKQKYNKDLTHTWVPGYPLMFVKLDIKNHTITIGGATANVLYVNLIEKRIANKKYDFPSEYANVLQLHQSFVGTHGMSCHGGGIHTTNLTKYIKRLNVINYQGKEIVYRDPAMLKRMACHMGLFGIVTEMEIEALPAYFGLVKPHTRPFETYFPSKGEVVELQNDMETNYYNEIFWMPFSKDVVIHNFQTTRDPKGVTLYPASYADREFGRFVASMTNVVAVSLLPRYNTFYSHILARVIGKMSGFVMTSYNGDAWKRPVKVPSCNALHPLYAVEGLRLMSFEWCLPLPSIVKTVKRVKKRTDQLMNEFESGFKIENKEKEDISGSDSDSEMVTIKVPDCRVARDLFVASKNLVEKYHSNGIYPQHGPLELRIVKGCDIDMCCGKDVEFMACMDIISWIFDNGQVITTFFQDLTDVWTNVICQNGNMDMLKYCRPHWAKYWQNTTVFGQPIMNHIRNCYKDDIARFNKLREQADPHNVFLNEMFSSVIYGESGP